jgi:hypothetical protein
MDKRNPLALIVGAAFLPRWLHSGQQSNKYRARALRHGACGFLPYDKGWTILASDATKLGDS